MSWLENKGVANLSLSIESGRRNATCVMATGIDDSLDSHLTSVEQKNGHPDVGNSIEVERDRLLDELSRYKIENERERMILEKNVVVKAISTRLLDMKIKAATIKTEKGLLTKSTEELLTFAR